MPFDDVVEVSNYVAALEHGMTRLRDEFPLSNRLLREMHGHLMGRGRGSDKSPGEFRRSQNWIGGTRPGKASFVPPPPHEVEPCMGALEAFLHQQPEQMPQLITAALAHVQFETIHPFLDGNGRLGRLLIALLLHHGGLLTEPLLYLSLYFKQHRAVYYDLLDRVRTHGDWEAWVDFFLEGVEITAQSAVATARGLVTLFNQDTQRVTDHGGRAIANSQRVLNALRQRPICSLKQLCAAQGMSFPTASKAMQTLVSLGIAREMTGQQRHRIFVYDAYLAILNEDGLRCEAELDMKGLGISASAALSGNSVVLGSFS